MNQSPATITRRDLLLRVAGGGAMFALSGCGSDQPPQPTGNMVMIIRNAEESGGTSLTVAGRARADALADLFSPPRRLPQAGLERPAFVYACASAGRRAVAVATVTPTARRLNLPVMTDFDGRQTDPLVSRIVTQPGPTLICAGSDLIPSIARAFDPTNTSAPDEWAPARYDVIWVLTQTTDGWIFRQIPELVLPGDQKTDI